MSVVKDVDLEAMPMSIFLNDDDGNRTFRPFDVSPPGRFAPSLDVSPPGRFATWTFRPLDVSPPGRFAPWTFRPLDVSPPQWTFRPRLWTFRHRRPNTYRLLYFLLCVLVWLLTFEFPFFSVCCFFIAGVLIYFPLLQSLNLQKTWTLKT